MTILQAVACIRPRNKKGPAMSAGPGGGAEDIIFRHAKTPTPIERSANGVRNQSIIDRKPHFVPR